jgi:hypothetical protein
MTAKSVLLQEPSGMVEIFLQLLQYWKIRYQFYLLASGSVDISSPQLKRFFEVQLSLGIVVISSLHVSTSLGQ